MGTVLGQTVTTVPTVLDFIPAPSVILLGVGVILFVVLCVSMAVAGRGH